MSEQNHFFSVIVPTRNRSVLLARCIKSLLSQEFTDWELIIIDDGSTDSTLNVVSDFKDDRIKYFYQEHKERSTARNNGIEQAIGKYVCFIDDDDYVSSSYLRDFYEYYLANDFPDTILRTGFLRKIGERMIPSTNYDKRKHSNPVNYVLYNMCGVGCLSIPRKALLDDIFPEEFPHWQDTHLFVRLLLKLDMVQLNSHNYIYNIHPEMGSKKATLDFDPIERANLNVAAIENLFKREEEMIKNLVPLKVLTFLKAEKYLEYAINAIELDKEKSQNLFMKSYRCGFFINLSKNYILYLYKRLMKI